MANVAIQRGNGDKPASILAREWEPLRAFRDLLRWDPFAEMIPTWATETTGFAPAFDVKETKENFVFTADLPGVKESDLEVRLAQNRLTICGKRESEKSEKSDTYYTYERSYGSFSRTFTLPEGVDANESALARSLRFGQSGSPAAQGILTRLHERLGKLIGPVGFDTLLSRALVLARRDHPALAGITAVPGGKLEGLADLSRAGTGFDEDALAVVSHFIQLLMNLIGEDLAAHVIRDIWPATLGEEE